MTTGTESLVALGVPSPLVVELSARIAQPPEGLFDPAEATRPTMDRLALLGALVAALEPRRFEAALAPLVDHLVRCERDLPPFDAARACHVRALAAWRGGDSFFRATRLLNTAIRLLREAGSPSAARAYLPRVHDTLGQMLHQRGMLSDARGELEVALRLREREHDEQGVAITLGNLGRLCLDLGDFKAAQDYLEADIALVEKLTPGRTALLAQLSCHLGQCALASRDVALAGASFDRSVRLARDAGDEVGVAFASVGKGRLALESGDAITALAAATGLVASTESLEMPVALRSSLRAQALGLLGDAQRARADLLPAIASYGRAIEELAHAKVASPLLRAEILCGLSSAEAMRGRRDESARLLREALRDLDATAARAVRERVESQLKAASLDSWLLHAAGRFLGQRQIDHLLEEAGHEGFRGEHREVVVLFSDIRGFTTLSEQLDPDALVAFLNDFLTRMTRCIDHFGGVVDKFIGDAVMAVFPGANGTDDALRAAAAMRDELESFNRRTDLQEPLAIGVGLHAGRVVAGLIGSPQKRELTVLGDVVNTASRLEGMTKQLGASILVSEALVRGLREPDRWLLRPLGCFAPKGRRAGVTVFDVMGERDQGPMAGEAEAEIERARAALQLLTSRDFDGASKLYAELGTAPEPRSHGYALLHRTARELAGTPPPAEWRGEIVLSHK